MGKRAYYTKSSVLCGYSIDLYSTEKLGRVWKEMYLIFNKYLMYPFNDKVQTTKKSKGKNPCYGIVIHHTAGGTYKSNMRYFSKRLWSNFN